MSQLVLLVKVDWLFSHFQFLIFKYQSYFAYRKKFISRCIISKRSPLKENQDDAFRPDSDRSRILPVRWAWTSVKLVSRVQSTGTKSEARGQWNRYQGPRQYWQSACYRGERLQTTNKAEYVDCMVLISLGAQYRHVHETFNYAPVPVDFIKMYGNRH